MDVRTYELVASLILRVMRYGLWDMRWLLDLSFYFDKKRHPISPFILLIFVRRIVNSSLKATTMTHSKSIIADNSFVFAIRIVRLFRYLIETKREFVLSKQLLRSGTAVGALVREARNAESHKDFIHKLGISQKECDETIYWLSLLKETGYLSRREFENIHEEANELLRMIRSTIIAMKKKLRNGI